MYVHRGRQQEGRRSFLETLAATSLAGTVPTPSILQRDDSAETVTATALLEQIDGALTALETAIPIYEVVDPDQEHTAFAGSRYPIRTHLRWYVPQGATQLESVFVQLRSSDQGRGETGSIRMKLWVFFPPAIPADTDQARRQLYDHIIDIATAEATPTSGSRDEHEARGIVRRPNGIDLLGKAPLMKNVETNESRVVHHLRQIRRTNAGVAVVMSPFGWPDGSLTDRVTAELVRVLDRYTPHEITRPDTDDWARLTEGDDR